MELVYYIIISMTSVGYGDFTPKSFWARISTILSVFSGLVLISSFIMALHDFTRMDSMEIQALHLYMRSKKKDELKLVVGKMFVTLFKIKNAKKRRAEALKNSDKSTAAKIFQEIEDYEMKYIELRSQHKQVQLQYDNFKQGNDYRKLAFEQKVENIRRRTVRQMQVLQEDCLENIRNMQQHVAKLVDGIQVVERLIENEQAMEF